MEQIARKIDYDEYFFQIDEIKLNEKFKFIRHDITCFVNGRKVSLNSLKNI